MRGKKGLSQVVTTILIILIILVAIGIIWGVVYNVIIKGTNSISLDRFTLDLEIVGVDINNTSGLASVKVFRNSGEGNLKSIKFIVEDDRNSDVFERNAQGMSQLETRTFDMDLTESDVLVLERIHKISIAPVYIESNTGDGTESEVLGSISDSVEDLDLTNASGADDGGQDEDGGACSVDSDCGEDGWVEGTRYCSSNNVMQAYVNYTCLAGIACDEVTEILVNETCLSGYYCSDGECTAESMSCENDSECGTDGYSGPSYCDESGGDEFVAQDYIDYTCDSGSGTCSSETTVDILENCTEEEICEAGPAGASCFIPQECSTRQDPNCDVGEVCDLETGTCVPEEVVVSGSIRSAWPYGSGEYFDSADLPQNDSITLGGYFVIFPGSSENRCLSIVSFSPPKFEGGISYVKLDTVPTDIADGDSFEIWETPYICGTL